MSSSINSITLLLIERCWKVLFHEVPSPATVRKIVKFFVFGAGMMVAKIFSIATQIIMGRTLGPEIYGQITIIFLLASYFAIPMVNGWGLVFTKIASQNKTKSEKLQALKSLLVIVFCCCILTTFALIALQSHLAIWLDIDSQMMALTIIMTILYAWWMLSKQIAQGFQNWKMYVTIENTWAFIVLAGILGTVYMTTINLITVCVVFFTGYFLAGLVVYEAILQTFSVKINNLFTKDIISHGWLLLLNGLVGVATFSIDRILINKTLGAEDVGIYQAHFLATYGIISAFMTILLTYIFPAFCRDEEKNIYVTIGKLSKIQYPITILMSIITGSVVLWLYSYPVSISLFISLCLFNGVQFHVQLKTWYIASKGVEASKTTLKSQVVFLVTNILILLTLIQQIGIIAGGISLLAAACASLGYLIKTEKAILHERTI